jgi:hypothetical protein
LIYRVSSHTAPLFIALAVVWAGAGVVAQAPPPPSRLTLEAPAKFRRAAAQRTASIHWQGVALGDAIARLEPLFDQPAFVDRRVDPNLEVSLDIEASSAEQVMAALAVEQSYGVARLGRLVYFGPASAAGQLRALAASRDKEVARLPANVRTSLAGRSDLTWPRLSEPRQLVESIAEQNGWRVANPKSIPHDLWAAGQLPELTVVEQLTVLLIGFDLTFELDADGRAIKVVPLAPTPGLPTTSAATSANSRPKDSVDAPRRSQGKRQVYTLRVQEKPVGAVLRELTRRLQWPIVIDEEAIRTAGKSLEMRVSFSVENADREKLLDELLTPAGLEYQMEGDQIRILPRRYDK